MKKSMYYAVYDISDNKTRSRVVQLLKDAGFVRIQKSVFCGALAFQQKKDLLEKLKLVAGDDESIYLILACSKCFGKVTVVGKGFDKEYVANEWESFVI